MLPFTLTPITDFFFGCSFPSAANRPAAAFSEKVLKKSFQFQAAFLFIAFASSTVVMAELTLPAGDN